SKAAVDLEPAGAVSVPALYQQRGLSCEYASLAIAMAHYGTEITEWAFDPHISGSQNPHWGIRGNINGTWGGTDDYGIYPEPLAAIMPEFGYWADVFYAKGDVGQLTLRLDNGSPVLVWIGLKGRDGGFTELANDGTSYWIAPGQHTLVIYGYDDNGVYASDPALGSKRFYDWGTFMWMWDVFDGMSMAIGPS
ncbi:MAG: C39 family peptidase, partial [Thermomicrobiales bacterium]